MDLTTKENVQTLLNETLEELRGMEDGDYPDLGIAYDITPHALRESYRKTMEAQASRLRDRLSLLCGSKQNTVP